MPPVDVAPSVAPLQSDDESLRLTAAVEAGLRQASQRVAASSASAAETSAASGLSEASTDQARSASTDQAQLKSTNGGDDEQPAASYPATLDRPESPTQPSPPGYVVVSDPAAVEGGTVVQQVQSIAASGVAQTRSAVQQLQEQLDARRQGG